MANPSEVGTKTLSVRIPVSMYVSVIESAMANKLTTSEYIQFKLFKEVEDRKPLLDEMERLTNELKKRDEDLKQVTDVALKNRDEKIKQLTLELQKKPKEIIKEVPKEIIKEVSDKKWEENAKQWTEHAKKLEDQVKSLTNRINQANAELKKKEDIFSKAKQF